jgi:hypothetical protein
LLPFGPETFVISSALQKYKNYNIKNYNFVRGSVWVRYIVSDIKGGTQTEGMLRKIFGPKRDEVTGGWRKSHNEELHNLYSTTSIIIIIKSKR